MSTEWLSTDGHFMRNGYGLIKVKFARINVIAKSSVSLLGYSAINAFNLANMTFWILNCSWLKLKFTLLIYYVFVLLN